MPRFKDISGKKLVSFFEAQGFLIVDQHGSHIKLRRLISDNKQTLIVPNHTSIRKGTIHEIYNQALQYIGDEILRDFFHTK
ncbi:MAG: type II toxin-antitoxin system HicA family toxin [Candidatus Vogelbacteria bacterium]|nr:type II toxin-antitoxin system HicA family toxin [Candidatus Vogelbacteria bacterium]